VSILWHNSRKQNSPSH